MAASGKGFVADASPKNSAAVPRAPSPAASSIVFCKASMTASG
eukprot:CAMPEP_0203947564 /NCGR_PEP_ID=MMETSP0359-20131031/82487_1 /ASSEMBLY_ACC=CAM_ASM_000338 /TAXON_ID=268821 /ORGANISM="Scrippsiella Hangoei, Strain SHTV-5" /LENGTH=42 /DNA_ID= /DNA_START= /DNA_END= /DNA_ORIENTATION=